MVSAGEQALRLGASSRGEGNSGGKWLGGQTAVGGVARGVDGEGAGTSGAMVGGQAARKQVPRDKWLGEEAGEQGVGVCFPHSGGRGGGGDKFKITLQ